MITTFSDALREMDRNTEIYMVEQLAKEVQEKDHALAEKIMSLLKKTMLLPKKTMPLLSKQNLSSDSKSGLPKLVLQINIAKYN